REQHPRAVGEAVDGEEPGQVEQGPRGEGAGDGEGLVEGRGTQGEEARQGAEEQGDGGEQQGAHGGGEVLQSAARGEFAAGPAGEEVGGPGGGGTGQREGEHGGRGERPVPVGGGRAVGAAGDGDLEEPVAQQGVADEPPGPAGHAGGRGAVGPAQRAAAQGGPDGRGEGDDADGGREEPGLAVGVAQGEHRGEAQGAGEQREDDPVGPRLQGCGGVGAGGVAVAGHAGEEFLGEGEDVAVPEAGGGPVGDAVGLQAGGDLQRVHGAFAELAVAVQEGLHGVGGAARPGGGPRGHPLPAARAGTTCATGPAGTAGATCIAGPAGAVVGGAGGVGAA